MTFLLITVVTFAVLGLIADRAFHYYVVNRIREVFENVPPFGVVPAEKSLSAEIVSIRTSDGLTLSGSLHQPTGTEPRGLVLFCPELNGNHWMATHYCPALLERGFAVLGFDFRNQGDSDHQPGYTPIHWVTEFEMRDVAAVLEFVESDERLCTLPLGIFGVSRGGAAALATACRYPRIRAVLADSAFETMDMARHFVQRFGRYIIPEFCFRLLPDWHINRTLRRAVRCSEMVRGCCYVHLEEESRQRDDTLVRLVTGKRDSYVSTDVASSLANMFGGPDVLWVVKHAKHNMARSVAAEAYDQYVGEHFEKIAVEQNSLSSKVPSGSAVHG